MKVASVFRSLTTASLLAAAMASGHAATQSFDVFARQNSTALMSHDASPLDTGLSFNSGDALNITATGSWDGGGCGPVGPNGTTCFGNAPDGINYFSLIGRVGGGSDFKVGDAFTGTASSSGNLFLAFLDNDSFNNTGFVTALVTVAANGTAVPEPQTHALVLGALGVLAFARRKAATRT